MADPTKELQYDPAQQEAICHESGPMLVLAGPGSGKTGVITGRINHLIQNRGAAPERILVITFTRAAAAEMQARSIAVCPQAAQVVFGTFHSVFYHILQSTDDYRNYSILSTAEQKTIMQDILRLYVPQEQCALLTERLLRLMSYCKNADVPYGALLTEQGQKILAKAGVGADADTMPELYLKVLCAYEEERRQQGKIAYDDILFCCKKLFEENEGVRQMWMSRFSHVMIDEFQDINRVQFEIIKLLAPRSGNVFAVGDDDQAIYGFRGSDPLYMRLFREAFDGCRTLTLSVNYRSGAAIVRMSQRLIANNADRFEKRIVPAVIGNGAAKIREHDDRRAELVWLMQTVETYAAQGTAAVLCRTNRMLEEFKSCLTCSAGDRFVPGRRAGGSLSDTEVWQDMAAMLRMADGSRERSLFFRFMNKPQRGFSRISVPDPVSFEKLCEAYKMDDGMCETIRRLERQLSFMGELDPYGAIAYAVGVMGYGKYIRSLDEGKKREAEYALEILQKHAESYRSLTDFTEDLTRLGGCMPDPGAQRGTPGRAGPAETAGAETAEPGKLGVRFMTYHAAKGLEFDTVILPGVNFGSVPHGRMLTGEQLEEERRMFYVAMTRAKKNLYISYVRDAQAKDRISVFLRELGAG